MALALSLGLLAVTPCPSQSVVKAAPKAITPSNLSMEVAALQMLQHFQFDKTQLEMLLQWSQGAAQKDLARKAGKASPGYYEKMLLLRKALVEGKDQDRILKLNDELDALHEKEKPALDDQFEVTELARKRAAQVYRLLRPGQLAAYLGQTADAVIDPLERLLDAMQEVRELKENEWREEKNEIAEEISRLAAGLDTVKVQRMTEQVAALLTRVRALPKSEFARQQAELESAARKVIGNVNTMDVLRHHVQLDLAVLLSNPRLPQACRALMKVGIQAKSK
jgi:hypothetical protein